jgi:hypothetical protein
VIGRDRQPAAQLLHRQPQATYLVDVAAVLEKSPALFGMWPDGLNIPKVISQPITGRNTSPETSSRSICRRQHPGFGKMTNVPQSPPK